MSDPSGPQFWEGIYARGTPPWDKDGAAPPLARALEAAALAVPSRVLVPGCGFGHEALHLAAAGHRVTAVDFAPAAVAGLRQRAAGLGLSVEVIEADLFDLPTLVAPGFDAVVEHTCFCAIGPERRDDYARLMVRLLRPGGLLIGLFFEVDGTMEEGPPFPATADDVHRHFGRDFDVGQLERPADSFPSRAGREWLATLRLVSARSNAED